MTKNLKRPLSIETLENRNLLAADFTLLGDINSEPAWQGTDAIGFLPAGEDIWFNTEFGQQSILWRSSGDDSTSESLIDSNLNSRISDMVQVGDRIVFNFASNEAARSGAWSMSEDGGVPVFLGPTMNSVVRIGDHIFYFAIESDYRGRSIWKSDGTPSGTARLYADRGPQNLEMLPQLATDNEKLFSVFWSLTSDEVFLGEIDKISGAVARRVELPDRRIGRIVSTDGGLLIMGGPSDTNLFGYTEEAGLAALGDIETRVHHVPITQQDGLTYFARASTQWWTTDGTAAGTKRFLDDSVAFDPDRINIAKSNDKYLFAARRNAPPEYFLSNGTGAGTEPVGLRVGSYDTPIATGDGGFYVIAQSPEDSSFGFYRIDAATGAVELIRPIHRPNAQPIPGQFGDFTTWPAHINGHAFWVDNLNGQNLLYQYSHDTKQVRVVQSPSGTSGGNVEFLAADRQIAWLLFGDELWKAEPSQGRLSPVRYPVPTFSGSSLYASQAFDGHFLHETRAVNKFQRWIVEKDQTEAALLSEESTAAASRVFVLGSSTLQLRSDPVNELGLYSFPEDLSSPSQIFAMPEAGRNQWVSIVPFGDRALLRGDTQLWLTDGTESGTVKLQDERVTGIRFDAQGSAWWFANDTFYAMSPTEDLPVQRFRLPKSVYLIGGSDSPEFYPLQQGVALLAMDENRVRNLWIANHDSGQVEQLADVTSGDASIIPAFRGVSHGRAIFSAYGSVAGYSLWSTDGTPEETYRLKHVPVYTSESASGYPTYGPALLPNGDLLISSFTRESGHEIWVTDGTNAGTNLFADISAGAQNAYPKTLMLEDVVLAAANTTAYGPQELFVGVASSYVPERTTALEYWVEENRAGAPLGKVSLADIPELAISSVSIVGEQSVFDVDSMSGILRLADQVMLDFESQSEHALQLEVKYTGSSGDLVVRQIAAMIRVIDLVEPLVVKDQVFEIDENSPRQAFIGQIHIEGDSRIIPRFRRSGGWPFPVEQETGIVRVLSEAWRLDYETTPEFTFPVTVFGVETHDIDVTIRVRDINEPPIFESNSAVIEVYAGYEVSRDLAYAIDPELTAVSYRLEMTNGGQLPDWIQFSQGTHRITLAPELDAIGPHELSLVATDSSGEFSVHHLTVRVVDPRITWHNRPMPLDVNNDGVVSPSDALAVINLLNSGNGFPDNSELNRFVDTNDDEFLTPIDALMVINHLNAQADGEGTPQSVLPHSLDHAHFHKVYGSELISSLLEEQRERDRELALLSFSAE